MEPDKRSKAMRVVPLRIESNIELTSALANYAIIISFELVQKCKDGFRGDGKTLCVNLDECASGMHKCDTFANCKDYVGTFKCRCNRGFKDVGVGYQGDCKDIDECTTGNHKCVGKNVDCKNLPGGYKCPCKKGFVGDMRRGCRGK